MEREGEKNEGAIFPALPPLMLIGEKFLLESACIHMYLFSILAYSLERVSLHWSLSSSRRIRTPRSQPYPRSIHLLD